MNTTSRTVSLLAVLFIFVLSGVALSQEKEDAPARKDRDGGVIRERVKDLGSTSFEIREDATEFLRKAGEKAVPFLEEGTKSSDAEVRWRSKALLREIRKGAAVEGEEDAEPLLKDEEIPFHRPRPIPPRGFRLLPDDEDWKDLFGGDLGLGKFQEKLREEFDDLRRRLLRGPLDPREDPLWRGQVRSNSTGIRIERGPDGRLRVETLKDGSWVPMDGTDRRGEDVVYGLTLRSPGDALRAQLSLDEGVGLLVTGAENGSRAAEAGIERHDVITAVNGEPVGDPTEFGERVDATPEGKEATLTVIRKARPIEVSLPVQRTRKF